MQAFPGVVRPWDRSRVTEVVAFALEPGGGSDVGEPGIGLLVDRDGAEAVWEEHAGRPAARRRPFVRSAGCIQHREDRERATTQHLDFGPDACRTRPVSWIVGVDFRKGAIPVEEVVARMESRAGGRGKRRVMGIRPEATSLPVAGGPGVRSGEGCGRTGRGRHLEHDLPAPRATPRTGHVAVA